jgi:hypothetical protein
MQGRQIAVIGQHGKREASESNLRAFVRGAEVTGDAGANLTFVPRQRARIGNKRNLRRVLNAKSPALKGKR